MAELPIVVETYPWLSVSFGAFMIFVGLVLGRGVSVSYRSDGATSSIVVGALAVVLVGFGLCLALQDVRWQFRLDETGSFFAHHSTP